MTKQKKATAALVLGILSLVLWIIPLFGLPIAIVGLVLSIRAGKSNQKYATAALVCSIIGLALTVANGAIGAYMGATGQHTLVNQLFK